MIKEVCTCRSTLQSSFHDTNMRTAVMNFRLPFIHLVNGAYCVPVLHYLMRRQSLIFKIHPIILMLSTCASICMFLKQLTDFISIQITSKSLSTVMPHILKPTQTWPVLEQDFEEHTGLQKIQKQFSEMAHTAFCEC